MIKSGTGVAQKRAMQESTARQFNGGLDLADSELNLTSKYARELTNMLPGIDGSLEIRQGTRYFADIADESDYDILDEKYFAARLVVMNEAMELFTVDSDGNVTTIWTRAIATAAGKGFWTASSYIVFDEFNGELIISDGVNKPLKVTSSFGVDYLADAATGSNINVPVSAITAKFNRHFLYAIGSIIHASETNAAGTWSGDAGTVFVGTYDVGPYVTSGDKDIVAMIPFKDFLVVMTRECVIPVQLTDTPASGGDPAVLTFSVPKDSIIANHGTVAPRTVQDTGSMTLAVDIARVNNLEIGTFRSVLLPNHPSRLIDKLVQKAIGELNNTTLHDNVFAVYDYRLGMYMLFMPNDNIGNNSYVRGFGYRYIEDLKINAWCTYAGWNWKCGTRSSEGRIFLTRHNCTKIFVLGDVSVDPINADYVGEQETFSDGTVYTDGTGNGPVADINRSGVPIRFAWELPRTDLKQRGIVKTLRYITFDTEGSAQFTCEVFVDNFYEARDSGETFTDDTLFTDDTGFIRNEPIRTPALSQQYIGKDAFGYGLQSYGTTPYGGGNNTGVELNKFNPTKGKTFKLRMSGETMEPLKFVALTLHYQTGNMLRMGNG